MGLPVQFAPLNIPFKRRIETLSAASWIYSLAFGGFACGLLTLYLILYSRLWWIAILYVIWIVVDRNTCESGGRRSSWVRGWEWWMYFRNYFPIRLHRLPWTEFDTKKNYLFCCFPHGIIPAGGFSVFATSQGEFEDYFPGLKPWLCVLEQHLHTPFFREVLLSLGCVSPSAKSLNHLLSKPGGGNAVGLVVGGVAEAYLCNPGQYKLVLRNRKGFIRLALKNGSPLVPVFSFGETDLFSQVQGTEDSWLKRAQESVRKVLGTAPIIILGRGFLQYSFGILPHRRPVNVVVGHPIPVEKTENPTPSQVDDLHNKFIEELRKLFDTQKSTYLKNAENIQLEFV